MKWMNGWSCQDYDEAPPEIIDTIIRMINEEREQWEADHPHLV